jgi:branched-chain amino acid transport system permease protein
MDYVSHILVMITIYGILAVSLDLAVGHTGLLSIAHASFYGLGAYASAILCGRLGLPFWAGLFTGMVVAVLAAVLLSVLSLRLSEDYFVIGTFGFGLVVSSVFNNWLTLTRGPFGIPGIPAPVIFGWTIRSHMDFLLLGLLLLGLTMAVVRRLTVRAYGRVLHGIREDEIFVQAFGQDTAVLKLAVFSVGACLAATAGSIYAHYFSFVDPTGFSVNESILILSMVIVGGPAGRYGALVGAVLLVAVPEALRFAGLPQSVAADLRQMLYGALLVLFVLFRPRGLAGDYDFQR